MSRASLLIIVGVLAILAPFSGLPVSIRTSVAVVLGAAVVGIGVALRSHEQHRLVAAQSISSPPAEPALEESVEIVSEPARPTMAAF